MKKIMILFFIVMSFGLTNFSYGNEGERDELRDDLERMLDWATNNLMPRSKKDISKGNIDRETRDIIKKIHANSHWLRGHMVAQINEGWSLNQIRDDYEQEEHFRDLFHLTSEAIERTDNREAGKLNDMLVRFFQRFVVPVGETVGYSMYPGSRRGGRHGDHGRRDRREREYSRHDRY